MSTTTQVERTAIQFARPPVLGDPVCTTNPTDCCGGGEDLDGVALQVETRQWRLPSGARIGETWCEDFAICCAASGSASSGPILTDCCDYEMPFTLACIVSLAGVFQTFDANWTGSHWLAVNGSNQYALRCNSGTWQIGLACTGSGGVLEWLDVSSRCTPNFYAGVTFAGGELTCGSAGLSVSFVGGSGDTSVPGGATYRLRVQKTRVYLPASATVGDPRCVNDPQDCCEDKITYECCQESEPFSIGRTIYAYFLNKTGDFVCLPDFVPMTYYADTDSWDCTQLIGCLGRTDRATVDPRCYNMAFYCNGTVGNQYFQLELMRSDGLVDCGVGAVGNNYDSCDIVSRDPFYVRFLNVTQIASLSGTMDVHIID